MTDTLPPPEWNETDREYPAALLPDVFESQAARTPDAPALRFRDETLSYAELRTRVRAVAARLAGLGVQPGSLVAVCMDRSIEMVVALYAIQRAGCAYVPIDPDYPDDRIAFMLEDLDTPILLTQGHLKGRFTDAPAR